jgi:two-component system osmolarity sensor histidine kinase EnvZ
MITKDFLPKSLFGRALLILVVPTVLIQVVLAYIFLERHWDTVKGYMANNLAGEIAFFVRQLEQATPEQRIQIALDFEAATAINVTFEEALPDYLAGGSKDSPEFQDRLRAKMQTPFVMRKLAGGTLIEVYIVMEKQALRLQTTAKRLESRTTLIFLLWMIGTSTVLLFVAVLFLRNQIRPIRQLAQAADHFGRGVDMPGFRPHGASEVRQAARMFIIMRERIARQLRTRTQMLAGISHDLRTPLTRMKLQLAMLGESEAVRELSDDVQQMEHMIQEYLDFARGAGREEAVRTDLAALLHDVVSDYQRLGSEVVLQVQDPVQIDVRVSGFRRMMHNLIDNALRYGKQCHVTLGTVHGYCEVAVDDAGPGIPEDKYDEVFRPFSRLDPSRNSKTGGVGLGLTIARDIAFAHGGSINLSASPLGGLRVLVRLPLWEA